MKIFWPLLFFGIFWALVAGFENWRADRWMRRAKMIAGHPEDFGKCQFCGQVKELKIRVCVDCEGPVRVELMKRGEMN